MQRFQATGAVYEIKKRPWLFKMPRHQADITKAPTPGNMIWTSVMVSCCLSPLNPGAIRSIKIGVARIPRITQVETTIASNDPITLATRSASSSSLPPKSRAYVGMKEAERTPSPKRFWRMLGIRSAARNASAASVLPRKWARERSLIKPAIRLSMIPAATRNAGRPDGGGEAAGFKAKRRTVAD
jgi:hypothetical protein